MKNTALVIIALLLGVCGSALAGTVEVLATPEPGTIGLLGLGLAGMGAMAWRRRK